jgi:excisionase family DNA binding protein
MELLSIKEMSRKFKVCEETCRRWHRDRKIESIKAPGTKKILFSGEAVDRFLRSGR